jgi:hypothetical protein
MPKRTTTHTISIPYTYHQAKLYFQAKALVSQINKLPKHLSPQDIATIINKLSTQAKREN